MNTQAGDEALLYQRAVGDLRRLARLETRRRRAQGFEGPAVVFAGVGDEEWGYRSLRLGCNVGDIVVCASRGMEARISGDCGFPVAVIGFHEIEGASLPRRAVAGAPRTVFVVGLQKEASLGRGCSREAIERLDADEFVYLD